MLKNKERIFWIFLLVLIASLSFFNIYNNKNDKTVNAASMTRDEYEYAMLLQAVYDDLKRNFVEEEKTDPKSLYYGAIKGMLEATDDPYTYLMEEKATEDFNIEMSGEFGGLGIYIGLNDNERLSVISPIEDTPAERVGLEGGDVISEIEGKSTKGLTTEDAVKILRGKPGTKVTITVERELVDEPLEFTITRDIIKLKSVKYKMLSNNIGYIRVTTFGNKTANDFKDTLKQLERDDAEKIIIDLRNNPGGMLDKVIQMADMFISEGRIVYTRGRNPRQNQDFFARPGEELENVPMVVLINNYSASASEIFAGAMQDSGRAVLVGTKTFGKFSVQNFRSLDASGKTSYKITVARYYTPSGRSLHEEGIEPDVVVKPKELTKEDVKNVQLIRDGHFVHDFVKEHPEEDEKGFELFYDKVKAKGINIRKDLLERLVYNERRDSFKEIVDLRYDEQLKRAIDILNAYEVFGKKRPVSE